MGQLIFSKTESEKYDQNNEYRFEPSNKEMDVLLNTLKTSSSIIRDDRVFYAFGYGKQTKQVYNEISRNNDFTLIWHSFMGKGLLRFLSPIIAGQSGLIKIKSLDNIKWLIEKLTHLSMIGLFSFAKNTEEGFVRYMSDLKGSPQASPEDFIKQDPSYFSLIIDGDNYEVESGLLAIVSAGKNSPDDLQKLLNNFGEYGYLGDKQL